MNSIERTRATLLAACEDQANRVVLLRGKWGTGKTFLWSTVSGNPCFSIAGRPPLYASLFGVRTINELKLRLAQRVYVKADTLGTNTLKAFATNFKGWAEKKTGVSWADTAATWLPTLLSQRYIILDDVERKHATLDTEEIMGMLDEFSQLYECRFLLLMNSEVLADSKWVLLHEKVIDAEIVLSPSPQDALQIAVPRQASPVYERFEAAVVGLEVTNIRGLHKIWKVVCRFKPFVPDLDCASWVPVLTLMVASHYKLADGLPPPAFIRQYNYITSKTDKGKQKVAEAPGWTAALERLGITQGNEFVDVAEDYLSAGILDEERLTLVYRDLLAEQSGSEGVEHLLDFYQDYFWNPGKSLDDIKTTARALKKIVPTLHAEKIADLIKMASEIGEPGLAVEYLDDWLAGLATRAHQNDFAHNIFDSRIRDNDLHHLIAERLDQYRKLSVNPISITDAISWCASKPARPVDAETLKRASREDYLQVLKDANPELLKDMLELFTGMLNSKSLVHPLRQAVRSFVEACAELCEKEETTRLAQIITREFRAKEVSPYLTNLHLVRERFPSPAEALTK